MPSSVMLPPQSLTAPLQGFLNAIVYGWTREEFYEAIITHNKRINSEASRNRADSESLIKSDSDKPIQRKDRDRDSDEVSSGGKVRGKRTRFNSDSGVFQHSDKYQL